MFQYVSIISVSTIPSRILFPRFTFQYVSIISQQCQKEAQFTAIYIPICFYYFCAPIFLVPLSIIFTFQYVFIISQSALPKDITVICIYIPICFYYFVLQIVYTQLITTIYIPICFYYFPSNVVLYNSTTILPSFVDPVIIFCFFKKIFSFFPKLCIFPAKRQLSTPRLFYLITGRQFSFYMNSPSVSNSSCIISPMPFPVSNSNSYLYVALWISITFRFLPLPIVFLSTFSGNF